MRKKRSQLLLQRAAPPTIEGKEKELPYPHREGFSPLVQQAHMLCSTIIPLKRRIFQTPPLRPGELSWDGNICERDAMDCTSSLPSALSLPPSPTWWETSPVRWPEGTTSGKLFENTRPSLTLAGVLRALITAAPHSQGRSVCVCARAPRSETTVRDAPRIINPVSIGPVGGGREARPLFSSKRYSRLVR